MTDDQIRKAAWEAWQGWTTIATHEAVETVYRAGMEAGRAEASEAKPKRRKAAAGDAEPKATITVAEMMRHGVCPLAAEDWLRVRRQHKAPLTRTAWEATKREADAARMPLADAVKMCAERSWRGFRAEYVQKVFPHATIFGPSGLAPETPRAREARERVERVAPGAAARKPGSNEPTATDWIEYVGTKITG